MNVFGIVFHRLTNPLIFTVDTLSQSMNNIILLLYDLKADESDFNRLRNKYINCSNVFFVRRMRIDWAEFSQIEATLSLLQEARKWNYQYFSLISGDDIPLMNNENMNAFLAHSYDLKVEYIGCDNIIHSKNNFDSPYHRLVIDYPKIAFERQKTFLRNKLNNLILNYKFRFKKKDLSHLPTLYKGSNWFTLTSLSVSYILEYVYNNPKYVDSFRYSMCGDEIFFQTILFNSKFRNNIHGSKESINDCEMGMRCIDWCSGPEYPKIFHETDFERIKISGMLFARKIASDIDLNVLQNYFG